MNFQEVATFETVTDEEGRFRFEELATGESVVYAVEANYNDVRYGSDFIRIDPTSGLQQVEVAVYDTSDDDSGVGIARTNWVIDFVPGALNVGQIMTFGNDVRACVHGQDGPRRGRAGHCRLQGAAGRYATSSSETACWGRTTTRSATPSTIRRR